jgi:hypothetical protein
MSTTESIDMKFIDKKNMQIIMEQIRSLLLEAQEPDETILLIEESFEYNGWIVTFTAAITDTKESHIFTIERIIFEPITSALCEEIFIN